MASYSFHLSFYATGLRADDLAIALDQLAAVSPRYGANSWGVYRSADDRYKFLFVVDFPDKDGFKQFWNGDDAVDFRAAMSGAFQNPVAYVPHTIVTSGAAVTA
ncbi:MAG: hypothetical protein JHD16_18540 [Solirubrobacteraceae bacterium]|nr:hypothetical protein [Solirubrobacteraceae bacterium]